MAYPKTVKEFDRKAAEIMAAPGWKAPIVFSIERRTLLATPVQLAWNGDGENVKAAAFIMKVLRIDPRGRREQRVRMSDCKVGKILRYFQPFLKDGKVHKNIDALKELQMRGGGAVTFYF